MWFHFACRSASTSEEGILQISVTDQDGIRIARIEGDLDGQTAAGAQEQLMALTGAESSRMLIDLTDLRFISSAGLRVLLVIAKELQRAGGALRLCGANASVRSVFEIAGFDTIIPMHDARDEAIGAF